MSNETGHLNRRSFLKGIVALGAVAALPGGLLTSRCALAQPPVPFNPKTYKIYRNACPRNCYDTCSLKTWVKDGVITFVEGAPESTFTHGTPCVKGLSYPRRVYSPDRIKYPMAQDVRGSGNWRRISWEEAMQRIAARMLEIKKKDGSMLGLALTKYSGKFGVLNYAVEGMMSSLGYTTRFAGTPCWPAGIDAQNYDMGDMWCNDPEDMVKAKYIIIWGANPAWCSMHSMKYIYQAREKGAKVVVIDPLLSQTAAKADLYLRVRPGSDGALALGMARHLVDKGLVDQDFVNNDAHGYPEFEAYLRNHVTVEWASEICGLSAESFASWRKSLRRLSRPRSGLVTGCSVMSTAAPTFALSMPLSLCPATSVSKAAARVMVICTPGALTTAPCCRSRRRALLVYRERRAPPVNSGLPLAATPCSTPIAL